MPFATRFISAPWFAVTSILVAQIPQLEIHPLSVAPESFRSPDLRVNVDLLLLPVTVTDRFGAVVDNLVEPSFTILEDNTPRPIVSFNSEDAPCSVGVVVDISGSMGGKNRLAAEAMRAFFDTANPDDEAFLLTVSTRPNSLSGFTTDFGNLQSQLSMSRPGGATALVDTVQLALRRLRESHKSRRALLIISDGMDNNSRYSEAALLRLAQEADVQIYTIGMATSAVNKKGIELTEEPRGLAFLSQLSERSGGLNFTLGTYENPVPIASKISRAIRDRYLIGYHPSTSEPGKWRAIRVKVNVPRLRVSTRNGYYAR
jgi:Ca-activated chloride channel family protein